MCKAPVRLLRLMSVADVFVRGASISGSAASLWQACCGRKRARRAWTPSFNERSLKTVFLVEECERSESLLWLAMGNTSMCNRKADSHCSTYAAR